MNAVVLAWLCGLGAQEAHGLELERSVTRVSLDVLGRRQELRRKERLLIRDDVLLIQDLTFGERWILRPSEKKIQHVDLLLGQTSELSYERLGQIRRAAFDGIRAARERVPGTADQADLDVLLGGFDQFKTEPVVESRVSEGRREIVLNGDRIRVSFQGDAAEKAPGWFNALASTGAFPPGVAAALRELPGLPVKGTLRYVFLMERVVEQFEVVRSTVRVISDAELVVPAGLQKVLMPGVERPEERRAQRPVSVPQDFKEDEPKKGSP